MWNWVDWLLAIIIVLSTVLAVKKGFARELISLAAVVVGLVVAAFEYQRAAAAWFDNLVKSHQIALACGFMAVFILVLIAGAVVSLLARLLVRTAGLEWFDRFMGGVFGLVRGVIVDSVLLMVLVAFSIKPATVSRSHLAPYVSAGARAIAVVMPKQLKDDFWAGYQEFRKSAIPGGQRASKNKASL